MEYKNIVTAKFISRPNRFVAYAELENAGKPGNLTQAGGLGENAPPESECGAVGNVAEVKVHVKNTGRCKELLLPGVRVYLEDFAGRMGTRTLRYSLIGVEKADLLINMDSQAPNKAAGEALCGGRIKLPGMDEISLVRREKTYGDSRIDFYLEDRSGRRAFLEVKGVTLEHCGIAAFPDAPTERGIKHIHELARAKAEGYEAFILFVIQMKGVRELRPNDATHRAFGDALREAAGSGVHVLAYDCIVSPDSMTIDEPVAVNLDEKTY